VPTKLYLKNKKSGMHPKWMHPERYFDLKRKSSSEPNAGRLSFLFR